MEGVGGELKGRAEDVNGEISKSSGRVSLHYDVKSLKWLLICWDWRLASVNCKIFDVVRQNRGGADCLERFRNPAQLRRTFIFSPLPSSHAAQTRQDDKNT